MEDDKNPFASPADVEPSAVAPVQFESSGRLARAPRLTIRYIMLVTAVTAAALTAILRIVKPPQSEPVLLSILALAALLFGWVCTAALLLAWHALRRTLWRLEPGEWLLLCLTNVIVMWTATELLIAYLFRWADPIHDDLPFAFNVISFARRFQPGAMAAVYLLAAVIQRRRPWWCATLTCAAALFLSSYAVIGPDLVSPPVFLGVAWLISLAILLLMATGIWDDRRRRASRHWMHWSGVGISATLLSGMLLLMTAALVLRW